MQSMGRVGSALDNAAVESLHSVLKVEHVHRHTFATRAAARLKTATWVADFPDTKRRRRTAGGQPPAVRTDHSGIAGRRSRRSSSGSEPSKDKLA
ncbi:integrase core domain-containing protein [Streptomyces sp. NPDC019645]|uniref:integrase core domain-containing protein n=1 Tax=Streptomyces sp. NPDC019645 TaxID=3154786 RepID=UPI0033ECBB1E